MSTEQSYHMFHGLRCRPRPLSPPPLSSLSPYLPHQPQAMRSIFIRQLLGKMVHLSITTVAFRDFFFSVAKYELIFCSDIIWQHIVMSTQTHVQEIVGELFLAQLPVSRIVYFEIFFFWLVISQKARFAIISITHMPHRYLPMLNSTTRCCTYDAHVEHMPANVDEDISGIRCSQQKIEMFWF